MYDERAMHALPAAQHRQHSYGQYNTSAAQHRANRRLTARHRFRRRPRGLGHNMA